MQEMTQPLKKEWVASEKVFGVFTVFVQRSVWTSTNSNYTNIHR
jgi:hypothetical protein